MLLFSIGIPEMIIILIVGLILMVFTRMYNQSKKK